MINYIKKIYSGEVKILKGDRVLWGLYILLLLISIVVVPSASAIEIYKDGSIWGAVGKHLFIVSVSFLGAIISSHISWKFVRKFHYFLYPIVLLLIVLTYMMGVKENDAQRAIFILGISIQPSELLKPTIVLLAASIFGTKGFLGLENMGRNTRFWFFLILVAIPTFPTMLQSGSTGLIIGFLTLLILYVSIPPKKPFWMMVIVGAFLLVVGYVSIKYLPDSVLSKVGRATTWKSRLSDNPSDLPDSVYNLLSKEQKDSLYFSLDVKKSYQRNYAQIAISRGAKLPFGSGSGKSLARDFLPEAHNDFIYAIFIEEWGPVLGVLTIPMIFLILFFRLGNIAKIALSRQQQLILYGIGILYTVQAFINMGMAANCLPLMGQTLPLISKGGSSFLFTSCFIGLTIGITDQILKDNALLKKRKKEKTLQNQEKTEA